LSTYQRALIRVLAIANRSSLDPGPLVLALAQEFPGSYEQRLKSLAGRLINGEHVLDALARTPGVLASSWIAALRLADQAGRLSEMYESLLQSDEADAGQRQQITGLGSEFFRFALVTTAAWAILIFLCVWILPTLTRMFEELDLQLPLSVVFVIEAGKVVPMLAILTYVLIIVYLLWHLRAAGNWLVNRVSPTRFGTFWRPPAVRIRSLLAFNSRLGLPLQDGLATIAGSPVGQLTARRLRTAGQRIADGDEPWASLAAVGLIRRREAAALAASQSSAAAAWILDRFAAGRLRRALDRQREHEIYFAVVNTVVLGALVALVAYSVFAALSQLIESYA
jgi:type IV pilus assembly protein PilC